uniref:Uncharacterized protein n=1 Tax=Panagrolaimus davidi TaxID=227884 RepID=A0A914P400_9BILA
MEKENLQSSHDAKAEEMIDDLPQHFKDLHKLTTEAAFKDVFQVLKKKTEMIQYLEQRITSMKETIDDLVSQDSQQKKFNKSQNKEIKLLKNDLKEAKARLDEFANIVKEKEEHSFVLNEDIVKLEEKYKNQMEKCIEISNKYKKIAEGQINQLKKETNELQAKIIAKDQMITRCQRENIKKAADHKAEIKLKQDQIQKLQDVLEKNNQIVKDLQVQNAELREENRQLCDEVAEPKNENKELRDENEQLKSLQQHDEITDKQKEAYQRVKSYCDNSIAQIEARLVEHQKEEAELKKMLMAMKCVEEDDSESDEL